MTQRPLALLLLGCIALVGCQAPPPPPALEVEVIGYHDFSQGFPTFDALRPPIISVVGAGPCRVAWWRGETLELSQTRSEVRGGRTLLWVTGQPPLGAGWLQVSCPAGHWLHLAEWRAAPTEVGPVSGATRPTDPQTALPLIEAYIAGLPTGATEHVQAAELRAMMLARSGRTAEAAHAYEQAAQVASTAGLRLYAAELLRAAAFFHMSLTRLTRAREVLVTARRWVGGLPDPKGAAQALYLEARLDEATARYGQAERLAAQASAAAWAVGDDRLHATAVDLRASLLTDQGRPLDALSFLQTVPAPNTEEAAWWRALNTAWIRLIATRSCLQPTQADELASQLLGLAQAPGLEAQAFQHAEVWTNMAYAYFLAGQLADATDAVQVARSILPAGSRIPAFADHLEGQIHLAANRLDLARAHINDLLAQVKGEEGADYRWRGLHTLGAVARAEGEEERALHLWLLGNVELNAAGRLNWLRSGRSTFLADRRALVVDLVGLLLEHGYLSLALAILDQSLAPTLTSLAREARLERLDEAQLARWSALISAREAARHQADEAVAACDLVPANEAQSCLAAAKTKTQNVETVERELFDFLEEIATETHSMTSLADGEAALILFAADDTCTPAYHRLLVTASGIVRLAVDVDLLSAVQPHLNGLSHLYLVGEPLGFAELAGQLIRMPNAPTVGSLPALNWLSRPGGPASAQVVAVADPEGDLPHARQSVEAMSSSLKLVGGQATRAAVLGAIQSAHLFHYEGHGDLSPGDPWNAHLRLADGPLTVADILALRPQIGTVVLSGCKTGSTARLSRTESLGLADAFLLAGADRVIAPDRDVPDAEAAKFVERFYAHGGRERPAQAFRAAVIELGPAGQGWRYFGRP